MRTTLASSDLEAVCAAVRAYETLPSAILQTLEARLRMTADTRTLAQRNADAVRQVLAIAPLTYPTTALVTTVRNRLVARLESLGLDRMPSDKTIQRHVQALQDKVNSLSTST